MLNVEEGSEIRSVTAMDGPRASYWKSGYLTFPRATADTDRDICALCDRWAERYMLGAAAEVDHIAPS